MKKIIWIDIGTHFAQEHDSIFSSNISFYSFIVRRLISFKIFNRGKFVNLKELKENRECWKGIVTGLLEMTE